MAFGAALDVAAPVEVYDQLLPEVQTAIGGPWGTAAWSTSSPHRQRLPGDRSVGVGAALAAVPDRDPHAPPPALDRRENPEQPPPQQFPMPAVRIAQAK
jgi:hypothetical protein